MSESKKIALVTGANRGIGKEIATELLEKGFFVIIACRKLDAGTEVKEELNSKDVDVIQLDVADEKSILNAAKEFGAKYNRLDVLVNNAGILIDRKESIAKVSAKDFIQTIQTNTLGPLLVTNAFTPYLIAAAPSRVINISSALGQLDDMDHNAPSYSISKTGLNAVTRQFASFFRDKGVSINSMCPGWVKTDMGGKNAVKTVSQGADTAVWLATEVSKEVTGKFFTERTRISW